MSESDALTVTMWCWPNFDPSLQPIADYGTRRIATFDPELWTADDFSCFGVRDAEQVVLERGLAEQYGEALGHALLDTSACLRKNCAGDRWSEWMDVCGEDLASIATAPLSVRLRALANDDYDDFW